jgi:hypothetical protein
MTDRELLELAARAAGLEFDPTVQNKFGLLVVTEDAACQSNQKLWNPLTDDGDALRLAVKLNLLQKHLFLDALAKENDCNDCIYAATRRAIVRAAAEIWKEKNK